MTVTLGVPKTKPEITAHYGLLLSGKTLKGSLFGGWKPKSDLPLLVDMYLKEVCTVNENTFLVTELCVEVWFSYPFVNALYV